MEISTTRFGPVAFDPDDIFLFPAGLIGFEDCKHWVLLSDTENSSVGWLQSISRPNIAMAVVSPRRFVRGYQLRVSRGELAPLQLAATDRAYVVTLISEHDGILTTNLKAPIVINLQRRLGRQVVTSDEQSLRHELARKPMPLRKTA